MLGTGFYKHGWLPGWVHDLDVEAMTDYMTREILEGGLGGDRGAIRRSPFTGWRGRGAGATTQV